MDVSIRVWEANANRDIYILIRLSHLPDHHKYSSYDPWLSLKCIFSYLSSLKLHDFTSFKWLFVLRKHHADRFWPYWCRNYTETSPPPATLFPSFFFFFFFCLLIFLRGGRTPPPPDCPNAQTFINQSKFWLDSPTIIPLIVVFPIVKIINTHVKKRRSACSG